MTSDDRDVLPLLSRGKHRNPRRGACFMELAGFLAGERWSDHPRCTHPLLGELARRVNDGTSDAGRHRLAPLIPSVIGLQSSDERWVHEIALLAATRALPLAPADRRPALAVGVLTCERRLVASGAPTDAVLVSSRRALESFPIAAQWARDFAATHDGHAGHLDGRLTQHPGSALVSYAVTAIVDAHRRDTDDLLRGLLTDVIDLCRELAGRSDRPVLVPEAWLAVCSPA